MIDFFPTVGIVEFLSNYTFRTMLIGTAIIGAVSGGLGSFLYLRKQSLISDVIGHSAIAGITILFIICTALLGINGRSILILTIGSLIASSLAVILANLIAQKTKLTIDAAMVICLSLFFGGGMVIMRWITHSSLQNRGGIEKYMFGNAATMGQDDLFYIGGFALLSIFIMLLLWKEFKLFTFDSIFSQTLGFKSSIIEPIMLVTSTIAIVIGIKAVGLILMVAYAVMPAAAARQWTNHLWSMVLLAMIFGAVSGIAGSYISVNLGKVPTGPVIVLVLFTIFLLSILLSPKRSIIRFALAQRKHRKALLDELRQSEVTHI